MHHHRTRRHRQITLQPGQVAFRVVCHDSVIGGLIGHSGSIISQIRRNTGCSVHCEEPVRGAEHGVIVVVGPSSSGRKIVIEEAEEKEEKELVSVAQEAVVRVCERMWEVDAQNRGGVNDNSEGYCGLLADTTQIGAVLGVGRKNVLRIRRESGAHIRILPAPPCAAIADQLIQITGDSLAVKRALVAVTECLHDCPPHSQDPFFLARPVETASYTPSSDPHAEFFPHLSPSLPRLTANTPCSDALSLDGDIGLEQGMKSTQQQVSFRLLCSNAAVGKIIGQRGTIVRTLQNETGASITFADPVTVSGERVVNITAFENLETRHSAAQNAVVIVFARSIEHDIENTQSSSLIKGTNVTARLLVPSDAAGCLNGNTVTEDSEITEATGAKIQILEEKLLDVSLENDVVVEITGEYINVQNALFQVTEKLRDSLLPREVLNEVRARNPRAVMEIYSTRMERPSVPYLETDEENKLSRGVDQLRISSSLDDTSAPGLQSLEVAASLPSCLASHMPSSDPLAIFFPHLNPLLPPLTGNTPCSNPLSVDGDVGPNQETKSMEQKVLFRLLCSNGAAGSIIGQRGTIVRALQNETGASINFAAPLSVSGERIVTITASENLETWHSPTQNAIVLVFARSIEHDIEKRHSSGLIEDTTVTARLLVPSVAVGCLNVNNLEVDSEITDTSGAKIQILEGEQILDASLENDVVVEITGEYINVQNALILVTGKLRDSLLPSEVLNEVRARNPSGLMEFASTKIQRPSVLSLSEVGKRCHYRRPNKSTFPGSYSSLGLASDPDQVTTFTRRNNRPKYFNMGRPSPALFTRETAGRGSIAFEASLEPERKELPLIAKTTVEFIVPEDMLGSVCGEDGCNLARLRQISGANVEVRDPSPSKSERMVIISGTPDQTRAAQSLLQAFVLVDQ
ncbi:RNA-binding KH domain-containing protein [Euphorbia peplus]|nr:RNA-binding KH domain-containing protein [Euphorbia peplus]